MIRNPPGLLPQHVDSHPVAAHESDIPKLSSATEPSREDTSSDNGADTGSSPSAKGSDTHAPKLTLSLDHIPSEKPTSTPPQIRSSRMMKTTEHGRPFLKDTLELFGTLIVSLQLATHSQSSRSFPDSFTTDEAALSLANLKFTQSHREPDPQNPLRIRTSTTTTTFSMTREIAKAVCQIFMDARLIANAANPSSDFIEDDGVHVLTPKGLHVLECFVTRNGISDSHIAHLFTAQPMCMKLLHPERSPLDDDIVFSQPTVHSFFRYFVGRQANYSPGNDDSLSPGRTCYERSKGIQLTNVRDRGQISSRLAGASHKFCFMALDALEWLCDFANVVGGEEAAYIAAQFVRFGLIALVADKRKGDDPVVFITVHGSVPEGDPVIAQVGEFCCSAKAVYKITEEGARVARWNDSAHNSPQASSFHLAEYSSGGRESNTERLRFIVEQPQLRHHFCDFLRDNFCEENLKFWLEVEDFKRKFSVSSSASSALQAAQTQEHVQSTLGQATMKQHHGALIQQAFEIYTTYLVQNSQSELNIDHGLRSELSVYLSEAMQSLAGASFQGRLEAEQLAAFNTSQLQKIIRLYERIQAHVFYLMATNVSKFTRTPQFAELRKATDEYDFLDNNANHISKPDSPVHSGAATGGAYITLSQQAFNVRENKLEPIVANKQQSVPWWDPRHISIF